MMDTSQRITTLCDGDKRSRYQNFEDFEWYKDITIGELLPEYSPWLLRDQCIELANAFRDLFTSATKQIAQWWEVFQKSLRVGKIPNKVLKSNPILMEWKRNKRDLYNNYHKIRHEPLMRRMRCRWRPRESHRTLSGLSSGIVIMDEYACSDERVEGSEAN